MAKKAPIRVPLAKPPTDGDGNAVHNEILLSLSQKECKQLVPHLELVRLKLHQVIYEGGRNHQVGLFREHRLDVDFGRSAGRKIG
jgi:hypothetical protein